MEACTWKLLDINLAILIICPSEYLASRYRSLFGDRVECDTAHSAFMFPISEEEQPRINWELSMYNVILVNDLLLTSLFIKSYLLINFFLLL